MGVKLEIALGHLKRRRRQTAVSLLGVALGVGFFIAIAAMMQGFQGYFVEQIIDVSPHVVMKDEFREPPLQPVEQLYSGAAVGLAGVKPKDELRGIKNSRARMVELEALPGLSIAPVLSGQIILRYGSKDVSADLIGIEPDRERQVSNLEKDLIVGSLDRLYSKANGIILGVGVANRLAATQGDTLTALSTAGVILKMKVVGIFETGIVSMDDRQAYALLKKVQVLEDRTDVINQLRMRLEQVKDAEPMARRIEARYGYKTESWEESNQNVLGIFVIQNAIMYSTTGAILVVACFGIFNIISTVVMEKVKDIAILKSMGFSSRDVEKIFLLEGLLVGLSGSLLGALVGYGLTELLASIELEMEGFVKSQGFYLNRSFANYLIAGVIATGAATLAALLPARKAARLDPVDIIRGAV